MDPLPAVFIHGAGRHGRDAWPFQRRLEDDRPCHFVDRIVEGDSPDVVVPYLAGSITRPTHLVAHSYGGLAALLLADRHPEKVATLSLAEPAALSLSTAGTRTRAHISALTPVFERADDPDVSSEQFAELFGRALGAPVAPDRDLAGSGERLRVTTPPWRVQVPAEVVGRVPTLVAVGEADTMYAEVAAVLGARGAQVLHVPGGGHRPQDSETFTAALLAHWAAVE